jgi:putative acetyltransferase
MTRVSWRRRDQTTPFAWKDCRASVGGVRFLVAVLIRPEQAADAARVHAVVASAFEQAEYTNRHEQDLVDALRAKGALVVSLVAEDAGEVVGHVAFSRVTVDGAFDGWFGLAPLSVVPASQRKGIGAALVRAGLEALRGLRARGCVLLGEPDYYRRFGFAPRAGLTLPKVPTEYFLALPFGEDVASGVVTYDPAFELFG